MLLISLLLISAAIDTPLPYAADDASFHAITRHIISCHSAML